MNEILPKPIKRRAAIPALALSVHDAAAALGVSGRTIEKMVARGELPSFRVGDRRLFSVDSLRAWVREKSAGGEI
ncbi:MAG: helix-turn-helix domain-containing protein [Phycisphaerales bacterium]|nr:helix-turn-helix domain-containing protein [Phycisphaerales bacterium]